MLLSIWFLFLSQNRDLWFTLSPQWSLFISGVFQQSLFLIYFLLHNLCPFYNHVPAYWSGRKEAVPFVYIRLVKEVPPSMQCFFTNTTWLYKGDSTLLMDTGSVKEIAIRSWLMELIHGWLMELIHGKQEFPLKLMKCQPPWWSLEWVHVQPLQ